MKILSTNIVLEIAWKHTSQNICYFIYDMLSSLNITFDHVHVLFCFLRKNARIVKKHKENKKFFSLQSLFINKALSEIANSLFKIITNSQIR